MQPEHEEFVRVEILKPGDGITKANKGDTVRVEFICWIDKGGNLESVPHLDLSTSRQ
ncbi:MAG: hypothetical protein M1839_008581 [Geoglossum umbratile]|nr:MAG: hypothetical protein M1839_008581 [Geoglossum umbratile]